jgi:hypothetical protein
MQFLLDKTKYKTSRKISDGGYNSINIKTQVTIQLPAGALKHWRTRKNLKSHYE